MKVEYQGIRMKDIRESDCRVCNLLHTLIQSVYNMSVRSAWAKTEFAHPTHFSKAFLLGRQWK
jgi:hypothetical protein